MKNLIQAAVVTLLAASAAQGQSNPAGFCQVADSDSGFSGSQGGNGWWYRFDRGDPNASEDMPFYFFSYDEYRWCATPSYGGVDYSSNGSHCMHQRNGVHTNSGAGCQTPALGTLCPTREWRSAQPQSLRVHVQIVAGTDFQQFELTTDGAVVRAWIFPKEALPPEGAWIDVPPTSTVALRVTPLGYCAGSTYSVRIYAPDCNSDGVPDAQQISQGQLDDLDSDGVPDICQQPTCVDADLFRNGVINGADLGILLSEWGPANANTVSDINHDGRVDGSDLGFLLANWGPCSN
jgi:hypothetical protein